VNNLPPHSTEAEQGVLACILQEPNESLDRCATELPGDGSAFYDLRHRDLFRVLVEMHDQRQPIDSITLDSRLRATGKIDNCGGTAYVASLADKTPSPANLPSYIGIIVDQWQRRQVIATCSEFSEAARTSPEPIAEIIDRAQGRVLAVGTTGPQTDTSITASMLSRRAMDALEDRHRGQTRAIATGFPYLDRLLTGGLKPGQLVVLAGRPSTGKTAFAMQIAAQASDAHPVGVFSLEMSADELALRELAREARNNLRGYDPTETLSQQTQNTVGMAAHRMKARKQFIDDRPDQTVQRIRATARRWKHREKIALLVIDYLQLIEGNNRCRDRREIVDEIARGLKMLAKELQVPVIALAQLNRNSENENRKPKLSDLRESGAIEQDADVVLMLYRRPGSDGEPDPSSIGCRIAKQRNGPTQIDAHFRFNGPTFRFEEESTKIPHEP